MKELHTEGLAIHGDPESCGVGREVDIEALTGARAGWVSSRETSLFPDADAVFEAAGKTDGTVNARSRTIRRGLRPHASAEPSRARTGRSLRHSATARGRIGKAMAAIR